MASGSIKKESYIQNNCAYFSSGLLIEFGHVQLPAVNTTGKQEIPFTYPVPFLSGTWPYIQLTPADTPSFFDYIDSYGTLYAGTTRTNISTTIWVNRIRTGYTWDLDFLLIGRWK